MNTNLLADTKHLKIISIIKMSLKLRLKGTFSTSIHAPLGHRWNVKFTCFINFRTCMLRVFMFYKKYINHHITSLKVSISIFSCLVFPNAIETKCYHWTIYWVKKSQNTQLSLPLFGVSFFFKAKGKFFCNSNKF